MFIAGKLRLASEVWHLQLSIQGAILIASAETVHHEECPGISLNVSHTPDFKNSSC
jgi:hypothetical protein